MKPDKVAKFYPGQEFRLDKRVIFVEYESMTGELVKSALAMIEDIPLSVDFL